MAKKIGAIVSLSIIGILILATIIMANVNVDYSIDCAKPTDVWVVYNSNNPNEERKVTDANAKKIVEFINNASKEKSLTALFNGRINKEAELVLVSNAGKAVPTPTGFYVRYSYENPQKIEDKDGKTVSYDELIFTVSDLEGSNVVKVYLIPNASNSMTYTHYFDLEADFESLYNFLVEKGYNV